MNRAKPERPPTIDGLDIRAFEAGDWAELWPIIREIAAAQETFTYDPAMSEAGARAIWIEPLPGLTVVAVEKGQILGSAKMGTNRPGPGSHVATASFMVAEAARGHGVGSALCRYALDWARTRGYASMQFNAVAASNLAAIKIYERLGFKIVGTVPCAFAHPKLGRVGLHIMYCEL